MVGRQWGVNTYGVIGGGGTSIHMASYGVIGGGGAVGS